MPADIDGLQAVVDRLTPLSTIMRGDLIRAQDWNALVQAVMDVARAILADGPATVPPHEHIGQVKPEWLDARLSTTIQRGPLGDPDAAARLGGAERSVAAVDGRVSGLAMDIGQLRLRLNEATAHDLERASQVSSLGLRVSGINDAREDVQALRTTLASVQDAVGKALTVAQQLTVNGAPVDVAAIVQRIGNLETFRDGLREPDGSQLDGARLRADLQAATAALVSKDELASAIGSQAVSLTPDQIAGISASISASIRTDLGAQVAQLGDAIRAETQQRLNAIHDVVNSAVADAVPSLSDAVLAKVRSEMATAITASGADLQALVDRRVADASAALHADFDGVLARPGADLSGPIAAEVGKQLSAGLQAINASMAEVASKNAATAAALTDLTAKGELTSATIANLAAAVGRVSQRVEDVAAADANGRTALETSLRADLEARDAQTNVRIESGLNALDVSLRKRIADNRLAVPRTAVKKPQRPAKPRKPSR